MSDDPDRYEAHYRAKLWELLPALYRAEDALALDETGPLEELVARIGAQAAVVRRSIDRLWEDQAIESCDDWLIPYLGDLLATNLVASLDARGRRVDVGKTIYYRRRKGTVPLLEELATDVTGWSVRVVEFFRRMGRTRHGLDPAIGTSDRLAIGQGLRGPRTRTPAGGLADLRDVHGALLSRTAFDEYAHTGDVRRGRGATGWYDIPHLGVFVWRLKSLRVEGATMVQDATCPNQLTFDPTGRDTALFGLGTPRRFDQWVSPREDQMPAPISADLLAYAFDQLYLDARPRSLGVARDVGGPPPGNLVDVPAARVTRDPRSPAPGDYFFIDPVRGRVVRPRVPPAGSAPPYVGDYCYGFASEIGAGPYDRRVPGVPTDDAPQPRAHVANGAGLAAALTAVGPVGTVTIDDSRTYTDLSPLAGIRDVEVRAGQQQRPLVRPAAATQWVFTGVGDAVLALDGVFLSGADIVLRGSFARVSLRCCTLDPGLWRAGAWVAGVWVPPAWATAADGKTLSASWLRIEGDVRELVLDRSILGPILGPPAASANGVELLTARDCIIQAADPSALALSLAAGEVRLERTTVLGPAQVHRFDASECLLHDVVTVDDTQHGCVRFTAFATGSTLPRQYESTALPPLAPLFGSRDFGNYTYAQVLATAGAGVLTGAENGSEVGAFAREQAAVKERSLLIKYQEYLPLGIEPVVVHVT